jgi:uncharacterized protein YndB with AHSA1/START domain
MSRIEHNVIFKQTVEVVFPYVANPEVYPQWQSGFLEAKITSEGHIGVGTTFRVVHEMAGRRIEVHNEVTAFQPNKMFAFRSISGNLATAGVITLQPDGEGTRAQFVFEAQFGGFFRLAEPLAARLIKRQQQADLEDLKKLLEDATGGYAQLHE